MKEDTQVQDLMIKRRKVIALWPFADQSLIGHIYSDPQGGKGWEWWEEIGKHPHLFQPLKWWQERKPEEMPEYVRVNEDTIGLYDLESFGQMWKNGTIIKVVQWFGASPFVTKNEFILSCFCQPASIDDYTNYINQQSNKK